MKPGFIYIDNNRIVWNAERKPTYEQFEKYSIVKTITDIEGYDKALKQWQESCIEIDNVHDNSVETIGKKYPCFAQLGGQWYWAISHYMDHWAKISPGQKAYIDGKTIVKLG